jgi:lactate dehydrogenase-like 2-hydroxyacid dehydrogenase
LKPLLLVLHPLFDESLARIRERFELLYAPDEAQRAAAIATHASSIQAVMTIGTTGLTAAEIDAMTSLTLICALGAGYENIAVEHALARGIVVANGAGTNDDCVADHAMALLLAAVRKVPQFDRACRDGVWRSELPPQPSFSRKRMGVVGLGAIGRKIAQRGRAFELEIGYHSRAPKSDVPYGYFDSAAALAQWCDYLVIATPGGSATRHLVDSVVLSALGPDGYVVNISRGSVIDTEALADALRNQRIKGAGLDVYESEPEPPKVLLEFESVVLSPHVAGTSPETGEATLQRFLDNAQEHFAGRPVLSPVLASSSKT